MSAITSSFTVEAGMAIRGQARRAIESAAWEAGLEIDTIESKGFFESLYRFTVTGDASTVRAFLRSVDSWARENLGEKNY